MAARFTIAQPTNEVELAAGESQAISFDVSYAGSGHVRAKIWTLCDDPIRSWLSLSDDDGGSDKIYREFDPNESEKVSLKISIPREVASGRASFKIAVADDDDLDNTRVIGQDVALVYKNVPPPQPKTGWWVAAALAVILVVGGAGLYVALRPERAEVPPIQGMMLGEAEAQFQDQLDAFTVLRIPILGSEPGRIDSVVPEPGSKHPLETELKIFVHGLQVAPVVGLPQSQAQRKLASQGLRVKITSTRTGSQPLGHVVTQTPGQNTPVLPDDQVTLAVQGRPVVIAPGVLRELQTLQKERARVLSEAFGKKTLKRVP